MGIAFIIIACFLWAFDALIRYPLSANGVSALSIVFTEHLLLSLIFLVILREKLKKVFELKLSTLTYYFIVGGLGSALATLCFTRAFHYLNPSIVIVLQKFQPVFVVLFARLFLKETISTKFLLWGTLGLAAAVMISYQDLMTLFNQPEGLSSGPKPFTGYVFTLLAIILWASATVFGKKLTQLGHQEQEIMGGRFFMGALVLIPLGGFQELTIEFNYSFFGKVAIMALVSGYLGMLFYYKGLKKVSARVASLGELFFPFCAVVVNWLFLGQVLTIYQIIGGVLLTVSSTVIEAKKY